MHYEEIRAALVMRRRELMTRYREALRRADDELASRPSEDVERATEQWDARVLGTLSDADLRELIQLTDALHRIDDGTYGNCMECGEPIGMRRLRALPTTRTCTDCAYAIEARPMHRVLP